MACSILRAKRNVWRIERANRAAALIDGAAFFAAVRQAFRNARHSIFVLGWDIDSRMRLVGETNQPDDGLPATLADFLTELVRLRPELKINLLLWNYSLLYANERELSPRLSLQWSTPEQISLSLDNIVPFGCSQHQKIIVVDNALAFCGGLDLTIRRWDTAAHASDNPARVDPSGHTFKPFHDVQMMVDGKAAHALAEIACERWATAAVCTKLDAEPQAIPGRKASGPTSAASMSASHGRNRVTRAARRSARRSGCFSIPSMPPSARFTSRTSLSPRRRSQSALPGGSASAAGSKC